MKCVFSKGFIAGTFDRLHVGHQFLLWKASRKVEKLTIVVARDQTVQKIKNKSPHLSELQRFQSVEAQNIPNATVRLGRGDGDFQKTLCEENPDILFLGYDQQEPSWIRNSFPHIQIERINAYQPEFFKSSKF